MASLGIVFELLSINVLVLVRALPDEVHELVFNGGEALVLCMVGSIDKVLVGVVDLVSFETHILRWR